VLHHLSLGIAVAERVAAMPRKSERNAHQRDPVRDREHSEDAVEPGSSHNISLQ
jgi:hypothetical protein